MSNTENQSVAKNTLASAMGGIIATAFFGAVGFAYNSVTDGSLVNFLGGVTDSELEEAIGSVEGRNTPTVEEVAKELVENYKTELRGPKGDAGPAGSAGQSEKSVSEEKVRQIIKDAVRQVKQEQSDLLASMLADGRFKDSPATPPNPIQRLVAFDPSNIASVLSSAGTWETPKPLDIQYGPTTLYFSFSDQFIQQQLSLSVFFDNLNTGDCYLNFSYASFDPDNDEVQYRVLRRLKPLNRNFGTSECNHYSFDWAPYLVITRHSDGNLSEIKFVLQERRISTNLVLSRRF